MQRTAYVDESEPDQRAAPGVYLLAAAIVADESADGVRQSMSRLLLPGQHKVHWNREPDRHELLARTVSATDSAHLVVVRAEVGASSERRRRLCLERLLFELEALEVRQVMMEARQSKQNAMDLAMLNALRARKIIDSGVRMAHTPGPKEPLLWMADVVAGAYGAHCKGDTTPFAALVGSVEVIDC